jgi:hypothetical protein
VLVAVIGVLGLVPASAGADQAAAPEVSFDSSVLPAVARQVPLGGVLRLEGVPLEDGAKPAELVLERVRVFADDARVVIHRPGGDEVLPPPDNVYLRGTVAGLDGTRAMLTVRAGGQVRGLVAGRGRYWLIASSAFTESTARLVIRRVDTDPQMKQGRSYACGTDMLPVQGDAELASTTGFRPVGTAAPAKASYTARVAIETDYEYYQLFGNTTDATDYAGDIISYASGVYDAEVDTSMIVSHVSLWPTNTDPWTQTSSACLLMQYGRYWNTNNTGVTRTITHYMSGKSTGGGIAWVGVLCRGGFSASLSSMGMSCSGLTPDTDAYGGGYGYSGSLSGSFDINNPQVVWDLVAVTHEIGHNFSSPHTHCYAGIGGNANPVDGCYAGECGQSGCYCSTPTLPCATPGAGCGTLMSYCHLLSGGLGNLSYTFGDGHPWGVAPERVPDRMNSHVVSTASSNPSCLQLVVVDSIFIDDFESGNTTEWSATVP